LIGGGWFFFFIRVNVTYEAHSPFRLIPADLFIGSLLASALFALIWEVVQTAGNLMATQIFFWIYILFTTVLFVTVPWS
ncbi:MAG: adenylyl-sulfate reductase, partial [Gammaproteobacteria bacterium]|nr:adenylyl-sulfate reductase [Gammaproteobacteria bacterium]NIR82181.1 adenylyl-sulfate reductase [Gammaproteobacteria bacterium]NIU03332.1 adenylyl-sulfate reductase [Gammaproteobacteria bacterium]NIV50829.1 adenylyl-sulfate reductase [Gammaproteobacteria bacterium]NIX84607.1 adenylyl-sulfate reductase [Gammaproteobacteria bacterium]